MKIEQVVNPDTKDLTIKNSSVFESYTGTILPQREQQIIVVEGDINTVGTFLEKRIPQTYHQRTIELEKAIVKNDPTFIVNTIESPMNAGLGLQALNFDKAIVYADKEAMTIELELDPENYYGASVKGTLEKAKEIRIFFLNEQKELSREDCIKLFRFNAIHFSKPEQARAIEIAFQKFSAKAFVELNKDEDTRGNSNNHVSKKVETGIPLNFVLEIPIYKGEPKEQIEVNICLDVIGTRAAFWFESVQLVELLEQRKDEIFARQLEHCKEFPIIFK